MAVLTFKFVSDYLFYTGETGWAATISCTGGASVTVNSITFTNDIENHSGDYSSTLTLYSGSPTVTNNPIKICADGSTSTYIKLNVSNTSGINFQILDESGNIVADATNNTCH